MAVGEAAVQQLQGAQDGQLGPGAQQVEHLGAAVEVPVKVRAGREALPPPPPLPTPHVGHAPPPHPEPPTWATSSCLFHLVTSSRRASASGKRSWTSCRIFHTRSFSCSYSSPDPRRSRISRSCSC